MEATGLFADIPAIAEWLFFLLLFVFAIHAALIGYHLASYSDTRRVAIVSFSVYLFGGLCAAAVMGVAVLAL